MDRFAVVIGASSCGTAGGPRGADMSDPNGGPIRPIGRLRLTDGSTIGFHPAMVHEWVELCAYAPYRHAPPHDAGQAGAKGYFYAGSTTGVVVGSPSHRPDHPLGIVGPGREADRACPLQPRLNQREGEPK